EASTRTTTGSSAARFLPRPGGAGDTHAPATGEDSAAPPKFLQRRDPVPLAHLIHGQRRDRERIPVIAEVDLAGGPAPRGAQHLVGFEQARLGVRDRRHLHPEMELDDHEHQERETVLADEAALERTLLDLALGVGVVTGEDVAEIMEHEPLGDAAGLAGEAE